MQSQKGKITLKGSARIVAEFFVYGECRWPAKGDLYFSNSKYA